MKKSKIIYLVLVLVLAFSITACKNDPEVVEEDPVSSPIVKPQEEAEEDEKTVIMEEFNNMVDDSLSASDLKIYIDEKLPVLGQLEGSKMIDALEKALIRDIDSINEKIWTLNQNGQLQELAEDEMAKGSLLLPKERIDDIEDEELKSVVRAAFDNHYKLIQKEGEFEVIVDYQSLRIYDPKITDEWKEYLAIMSIDSEYPPFVDGALNTDFNGLADRILKTENYLNRYISGERQDELIDIYENKLTAYLKGLPNTPIADYDTKVIFDNVINSYENTAASEGYITAAMTYLYLEDIKENNNIIDDDILLKADEYIEEAVRTLREYK